MTAQETGKPAATPVGELENELTVALRQFWWLHDARWYQGVKKRFGQEVANEINAEALRFVGRRVGSWYANREGTPDVCSPAAMQDVIETITRIMTNEGMMRSHTEPDPDGGGGIQTVITEHFALRMLRAARSLEGYDCPCLDMRGGWFEGLGVDVRDENRECMRTGGAVCRFHTESVQTESAETTSAETESVETESAETASVETQSAETASVERKELYPS
ncbi:hypothetical protein ACFWIY_14860 [Streptomyces sioyaensis]|uniref:hypothetical protein n=1 Tax=Streptomyces sioyaensis TaxID=67364 RepID=UPI003662060A